jgi:hypothetical protein
MAKPAGIEYSHKSVAPFWTWLDETLCAAEEIVSRECLSHSLFLYFWHFGFWQKYQLSCNYLSAAPTRVEISNRKNLFFSPREAV